MIQIVGLIVAVYCFVRLLQAPLRDKANFGQESSAVLVLSILGCLAIAFLTLCLLMSGVEIPK